MKKVLVIDDDSLVRTVVSKAAARHNAVVELAQNGREALDLLAKDAAYDAIVLDLIMPQATGWDVLTELRNDARTADIPVAIMSAAPISVREKEKLAALSSTFIKKDTFSLAEFDGVLQEMLSNAEDA
jgi:CheY-like chemotaxis protein